MGSSHFGSIQDVNASSPETNSWPLPGLIELEVDDHVLFTRDNRARSRRSVAHGHDLNEKGYLGPIVGERRDLVTTVLRCRFAAVPGNAATTVSPWSTWKAGTGYPLLASVTAPRTRMAGLMVILASPAFAATRRWNANRKPVFRMRNSISPSVGALNQTKRPSASVNAFQSKKWHCCHWVRPWRSNWKPANPRGLGEPSEFRDPSADRGNRRTPGRERKSLSEKLIFP